MTRPRDLDLVSKDSEVALSARGDSAVLERQEEASEPISEPVFPTSETQSDLDPDSSLGEFFRKFE